MGAGPGWEGQQGAREGTGKAQAQDRRSGDRGLKVGNPRNLGPGELDAAARRHGGSGGTG